MMQEGALTSFAIYDPCRANMTREQKWTSESMSLIDDLILSHVL